ncbi:MAG: bifunctional riboflavin kinase/FAD synthetase [Candidatus Omnitrophota bacterium]
MKVCYGAGKINHKFRRPVLSIGVFDGVHLGHKYIIKKIVERARRIRGTSIVFTFYPHPYHVLKPHKYLPLLISLEHRIRLLADLGVDVCIVQGFTERFSKIDKIRFIENILLKEINPSEIFVGKDFNFGKNKLGNIKLLTERERIHNFKVRVIPTRLIGTRKISSTLIRSLIQKGNLKKAARFLGRRVSIFGKIVKGSRRGKILGFPTANIDYKHEVLPSKGVYAVKIKLDKKRFLGVANIGLRPSFKKSARGRVVVEVYIFNFNKRIYGKSIEVEFVKKIRNENKFKNRSSLVRQIEEDLKKTRQIFKSPTR